METSGFLLTILVGFVLAYSIAYIIVNHEWKKAQQREVPARRSALSPQAESSIPSQLTATVHSEESAVTSQFTIASPSTQTIIPTQPITEESVTIVPERPFVVRMSGIRPVDRDESKVRSLLKTIWNLSDGENECVGNITVVPSCSNTDRFVAIVDFKVRPNYFSFLREGHGSREVPEQNNYYLDFDAVFLGLTQMYSTRIKPIIE